MSSKNGRSSPKSHPHYLLLKIIANSLYGTFAELNKESFGKNNQKHLRVYSGDHYHKESTFDVELQGLRQFPPAAALITAGGRLMLAVMQCMARERGGIFLLTDTDSMLFVASERGGLDPLHRWTRNTSGWLSCGQGDDVDASRRNLQQAESAQSL